jgi:aspartyl-tRNA(Asn)/glutamyl-tRNA(Gln) amidotransferase subunit C
MATPNIDRKTIEHLAALARLKLSAEEQEKLVRDLGNILAYFNELQALDTTNVVPMSGGTRKRSAFRDDAERESTDRGAGTADFPETADGFLKVPPVFGD